MENKKRIIVGATGASGLPILKTCLELIQKDSNFESHLIMSSSAKITLKQEMQLSPEEIYQYADYVYDINQIGAKPASGTFENEGMLIVPCSMKTVAGIHSGYADTLLLRSADVAIKEQRKLILAVRETPLSPIHLRNMQELSIIPGVQIIPPMLTFYHMPKTIDDMVYHIACKLVSPFGVHCEDYKRWKGVD